MKPSDRIKELAKVTNIIGGQDVVTHDFLWGIIAYLDEIHEQQKPCEHDSSYAVDSTIEDIYYNVCNDCGVLFLRRQDVE